MDTPLPIPNREVKHWNADNSVSKDKNLQRFFMGEYMNKKKVVLISILVLILAIFVLLDIFEVIGLKCPFYELLHIYCPGCGTTRMIRSLLHFEIYQAFRYNPLVFTLLFAILGIIIAEIVYFIRNKKMFNISTKIYVVLVVITIIYWILRNIPFFSWLAPTVIK